VRPFMHLFLWWTTAAGSGQDTFRDLGAGNSELRRESAFSVNKPPSTQNSIFAQTIIATSTAINARAANSTTRSRYIMN
jgi:hypothetical protein